MVGSDRDTAVELAVYSISQYMRCVMSTNAKEALTVKIAANATVQMRMMSFDIDLFTPASPPSSRRDTADTASLSVGFSFSADAGKAVADC